MSTYTPIASITLASAASSVTFSGIPQTYTDLVVVANLTAGNTGDAYLRFNSDTGNNYSNTTLRGNGSAASSVRDTSVPGIDIGVTSSIAGSEIGTVMIQVQNYSNSTTNKTSLIRYSEATGWTAAIVGLWRNTNAISSLSIVSRAGDWGANSTFNLYGIANASITNVAKATGGDSVYTDGTYWYHIFRSSGTFTPTQALTADYLAVGGGAIGGNGGSSSTGAGGGGGGSSSASFSALTNTNYTITVGAGGTYSPLVLSGSSSTISGSNITTITAGGGQVERAGRLGGLGGTGTSGNGGTGGNGAVGSGGGTNGQAGNAFSITGSSVTYGGGGGGAGFPGQNQGTGGAGGGGNAGNPAQNGTANTGGGGGGCSADNTNGGNGGSGIVVIRYLAA